MKKKSNPLQYVRSRIDLLEQEREYYDILRKKIVRKRRTKIITTISNYENANDYEYLKNMILAGSNSFLINMGQSNHQTLHALNENRIKLEKEFKQFIPIICNLKGSIVRIGNFNQPEVYLKKGKEFRIILNNDIIGDELVCALNDDSVMDKINVDDKLLVDYGQVSLTIKKFEKSNETLEYLQKNFKYQKNFTYYSQQQIYQIGQQYLDVQQQQNIDQNYNKITNVIVCIVDYDCLIKPNKPIFIQKKNSIGKRSFDITDLQNQNEEIDHIIQSNIPDKDIKDFEFALQEDVDCISLSNIRTIKEIQAYKEIFGEKLKKVQLICKIQMPEAVENIEGILEHVDAIQIARGYLAVYIPVEKLFFKQKQIIEYCHLNCKPIFVSCNILDSMVTSLFPSPSEVGQISNLVSDNIDGIILSGETSHGMHPIESINTLSRICVETEAKQIVKFLKDPNERGVAQLNTQNKSIKNCQINCTLEAAYKIQASLIITFTKTGFSAIQYSKLKSPCTVLAICLTNKIARVLNLISGSVGYLPQHNDDQDTIIEKVIQYAQQQELVQQKDFIIINISQTGSLASQCIKIIQIE